jgi:hypothetical protein
VGSRRLHRRLGALCVAAAVGVTACTSHQSNSRLVGGGIDALKPTTVAGQPQLADTPAVTLTSAQARGLTSMPWVLTGIDRTGRVLGIVYAAGDGLGSCVTHRGIMITETPSTVTISALSKTDPTQAACPASLRLGRTTVQLAQPIGHRDLLHPPVDSNWANVLR